MLKHLSSGVAVVAGLLAAQPLAADAATTYRSAPAEFGSGTAETWINPRRPRQADRNRGGYLRGRPRLAGQ
jgi:hypothetical protein